MKRIRTQAVCCVVLGCALATSATAASQSLPDSIQACRKVTDDAQRLACFDREIAKFDQAVQQSFGLTAPPTTVKHPSPQKEEPVRHVTAKVVDLRDRAHEGFVVTLDNGQVWVQNELEATRGVKVGDTVTIKPAAFGSFWLVGPTGLSTKVHRVQ